MKSVASLSTLALLLCVQSLAANPVPPAPYLLFSNWFNVSRANLDGSDYSELSMAHSQSVDYHLEKELLFWNDHIEGTIHQADIENVTNSTTINLGGILNLPSGLAVDWIHNKLYFSYNDEYAITNRPNHLAYYDIHTGEVTDITPTVEQQQNIDNPKSPYVVFFDLAVDPVNEKLYWTTGNQIIRSSLDGKNIDIIHDSSCPARYIGLGGGRLFWSREFCGRFEGIRSIDLSTAERRTIVEKRGHYNDVAMFGDTVYWSSFGRIYSAPASGEGPTSVVLSNYDHGVAQFRGLVVVHPSLQPNQ